MYHCDPFDSISVDSGIAIGRKGTEESTFAKARINCTTCQLPAQTSQHLHRNTRYMASTPSSSLKRQIEPLRLGLSASSKSGSFSLQLDHARIRRRRLSLLLLLESNSAVSALSIGDAERIDAHQTGESGGSGEIREESEGVQ